MEGIILESGLAGGVFSGDDTVKLIGWRSFKWG